MPEALHFPLLPWYPEMMWTKLDCAAEGPHPFHELGQLFLRGPALAPEHGLQENIQSMSETLHFPVLRWYPDIMWNEWDAFGCR